MAVEPAGVVTRIYQVEVVHPYGADLLLYDHRIRRTAAPRDERSAQRLVNTDRLAGTCPQGRPGAGTVTLPFDVFVGWVESRVWSTTPGPGQDSNRPTASSAIQVKPNPTSEASPNTRSSGLSPRPVSTSRA